VVEPINFVDLKRQYDLHKGRFDAAIKEVCSSGAFILGPAVKDFEDNFASYIGVKHAVGVASGTAALLLACKVLNIGSGDEVLYPTNTFIATALAIRYAGAKPIPVDVDPDTYLMDIDDMRRKVTSRTKAVVPVHLYGQSQDMDTLTATAHRLGLTIIEDACQSHGAQWNEKRCGSFGDLGCFSFYPAKNLGAFGDGGMVVTNNGQFADRLRQLRNYGQREKNIHDTMGGNLRLDSLQAAVLNVKLDMLNNWNEIRFEAACLYVDLLKNCEVVVPQFNRTDPKRHVFHLFVIQCDQRDDLICHLRENKIDSGVHYPIPVHLQGAMADLGGQKGDCPIAESIAPRLLSLPIFPEIHKDEIERVCSAVCEFYG
jgi:dTDP-4-amino-4,6-dideoxygalactose transaminase